MSARPGYNMNSSGAHDRNLRRRNHADDPYPSTAVKRIMQEARELANDPSTDYTAAPLEVRFHVSHASAAGLTLPL